LKSQILSIASFFIYFSVGAGGKKRKREYDFESGSDSGEELDEPVAESKFSCLK
jgi:hypothetical protein